MPGNAGEYRVVVRVVTAKETGIPMRERERPVATESVPAVLLTHTHTCLSVDVAVGLPDPPLLGRSEVVFLSFPSFGG